MLAKCHGGTGGSFFHKQHNRHGKVRLHAAYLRLSVSQCDHATNLIKLTWIVRQTKIVIDRFVAPGTSPWRTEVFLETFLGLGGQWTPITRYADTYLTLRTWGNFSLSLFCSIFLQILTIFYRFLPRMFLTTTVCWHKILFIFQLQSFFFFMSQLHVFIHTLLISYIAPFIYLIYVCSCLAFFALFLHHVVSTFSFPRQARCLLLGPRRFTFLTLFTLFPNALQHLVSRSS